MVTSLYFSSYFIILSLRYTADLHPTTLFLPSISFRLIQSSSSMKSKYLWCILLALPSHDGYIPPHNQIDIHILLHIQGQKISWRMQDEAGILCTVKIWRKKKKFTHMHDKPKIRREKKTRLTNSTNVNPDYTIYTDDTIDTACVL